MDQNTLYRDIAGRCDGDIYLGVVGPVRTGKSTFIKRFMELLVLPGIQEAGARERATDALPQSGAGHRPRSPGLCPTRLLRRSAWGRGRGRVRLVDCGYLSPARWDSARARARMVRSPGPITTSLRGGGGDGHPQGDRRARHHRRWW